MGWADPPSPFAPLSTVCSFVARPTLILHLLCRNPAKEPTVYRLYLTFTFTTARQILQFNDPGGKGRGTGGSRAEHFTPRLILTRLQEGGGQNQDLCCPHLPWQQPLSRAAEAPPKLPRMVWRVLVRQSPSVTWNPWQAAKPQQVGSNLWLQRALVLFGEAFVLPL